MFQKIWLLFAAVALVICAVSCDRGGEARQNPAEKPRMIMAAPVERRDMSVHRIVTAPVVAYRRVYITARTAGLIVELPFEEGDRIREGEMLARLDTRRQQAQLRKAKSALEEARGEYERARQLHENALLSPSDFEMAALAFERAESEADYWRVEVEFGEIRSPMDAVISAKHVEVGTAIAANDRLFTIEDHELLVVRPMLSELDLQKLAPGSSVPVSFDVLEGALNGKIRRIYPSADPQSRLFTVEIALDSSDSFRVRPGYLARVRFALDERPNALAIPADAVLRRDGQAIVYVVKENRVEGRTIKAGVERDGWVEVLNGLDEGSRVAAGNLHGLKDGAAVSIAANFRRYGFRE
jgi:membrane fusion protein, multidrug efflux system